MPTLNENFGHSILESFCAGCPVIISDQTPWNGLQAIKVGVNVRVFGPQVIQELSSAINDFARMDENTFNAWGLNAYHYGSAYQRENAQREASIALFA
jgi:glycosyltransferase involved in cell wall biosynthesis